MDNQAGFNLIEVLISLFILSASLLGIAGLQMNGLKLSDSTHIRSQAVLFSYEILDYMRANRTAAVSGNYNIGLSELSDLTQPITGASIAVVDRYAWFRNVDAVLPGMKGAINCSTAAICTMTVQWDDSHAEGESSTQQLVYVAQI